MGRQNPTRQRLAAAGAPRPGAGAPRPDPDGHPVSPAVSVILVSSQTRDRTVACLRTLSARSPGMGRPAEADAVGYEVIVVDNASTDGSADAVRAACPAARVIEMPANVGFGWAVNAGAALARAPYLLLLNPETLPVGDIVGDLLRFARQRPGHGIYSGRTRRPDGSDEAGSSFGAPTLWDHLCFATGLSTMFPRAGCVALIDRELFRRLGGFDPRYLMYGEHVDLGLRARAAGARPIYHPAASVLHANGASSTVAARRVMVLRAKSTLVHVHWSPRRARTAIALLRCGVAARALGTVALRRLGRGDETWIEAWRQRSVWSAGWAQQHQSVTSANSVTPE